MDRKNISKKSVCLVSLDINEKIYLRRIADINDDGKVEPFILNQNAVRIFENRDKLFVNEDSHKKDFLGIWEWNAIPNKSDESKDYIQSFYYTKNSPIEIVEFHLKNIEELVEKLKKGVPLKQNCERILFAIKLNLLNYNAILCDSKSFKNKDGLLCLDPDITSFDVYEFCENAIIKKCNRMIYNNLHLSESKSFVLTKSKTSISKDILLKRMSWSIAKQKNMTKAEWKKSKELIKEISDEYLLREISEKCHCTEVEAQQFINQLISNADKQFDDIDITQSVLIDIINHNEKLRLSCEAIVEKQWTDKHQQEIDKKNTELSKCTAEKQSIEHEIEISKETLETTKKKIEKLKTLEESVKSKVQQKIEQINADASELISQMAIIPSIKTTFVPGAMQSYSNNNAFCSGAECFDDTINTYGEAVESIADELHESGVNSKYATSLAACLYSAYYNHVPLLLSGPNGESIANAFSVGLFGKYVGVLDCSYNYNSNTIEEINNSDNNVIVIKNPLCAEWRNSIMYLLEQSEKFFILLVPFVEDLLIEPKGLFNYVLPLFTESIIDNRAGNHFLGKKKSDNYEEYTLQKIKPLHNELLKQTNASNLLISRIQRIMTDLHYLDENSNRTVDYLYFLFPYFYIVGLKDKFIEKIKSEDKLDKDKLDYMIKSFGEEI